MSYILELGMFPTKTSTYSFIRLEKKWYTSAVFLGLKESHLINKILNIGKNVVESEILSIQYH